MAKAPARFNLRERAQENAQKVRAAFSAAQSRTGNEGQLIAFSAGGLLLAFFLLALLAPLAMRAPGLLSTLVGLILFGLVFVSTALGAVALWRIVKAGVMDRDSAKTQNVSIYSQAAIEAALSDAEDAGLRALLPRQVSEAMTGRVFGRPVAVAKAGDTVFGVVRLKEPAKASYLLAPGNAPWPFVFPNDGALTPLEPPANVVAMTWTTNRDHGRNIGLLLASTIAMSAAGGEVPFISVRGRALVMMWQSSDVGTACVLAHEAAKAFS